MEQNNNRFIIVHYTLYDADTDILIEKTEDLNPFMFVSNTGKTLPAFEAAVSGLQAGANFDFTLTPDEAYGDYNPDGVKELERELFLVNGVFDDSRVREGAVVPMLNQDGQVINGTVLEVGSDLIKLDFNHPLAGKALHFKGMVVENREATEDDMQLFRGGCCGGGCSSGGCGCGSNESSGSCGCGSGEGGCGCSGGGCGSDDCGCGSEEESCGCGGGGCGCGNGCGC